MRIVPGVRIATIEVGGLRADEAREKTRDWARAQTAKAIVLHAPQSGRAWNLSLADAGARFDVDGAIAQALAVGQNESLWERIVLGQREREAVITPPLKLSEAALDKALRRIGKTISVAPQNARGAMAADGTIKVIEPERKGVQLDVAATHAALLKGGPDSLRNGADTTLVIQEQQPAVTSATLESVRYPLVALDPAWPCTKSHLFTTYYGSSSSNRRHNIELATSHINGTILAPGEVFSYNKVVGPREPKLGFRDAPTYQDGQVVPGPGGGVCQTSTTLYNAVLRSPGMTIVQRSHHSMPVHYVPAGCDATVAYGSIDFQFRNDTANPVLVAATTKDGKLSFGLFGAEAPTERQIRVIAGDRRYNPSGTFSVTTRRQKVDADGNTHIETLSNDTYAPYHGG